MGSILIFIGVVLSVVAAIASHNRQPNKGIQPTKTNSTTDNSSSTQPQPQPADFGIKRYCHNCGTKILQDAKFCFSCGAQLYDAQDDNSSTFDNIERPKDEWKVFFRKILSEHFSNYEIQEEVPVTHITDVDYDVFKLYKTRPSQVYKAEWGQPYTFVIKHQGTPRLCIMLGNDNEHQKGVKFLISQKFAKKVNIPYLRFYTKMLNKEEYVVQRIRESIDNQ